MRKSSRFLSVGLGLLLLVAAVLSSACSPRDEDDRPIIIISSGSVNVDVTPGTWTKESGSGKKYKQKDSKGKSVKSFSATTGTCTVSGEKLVVTYGSYSITLERKKSGLFGKHDAQVQFPDTATVTQPSPSMLTVTTTDTLVRVSNGGSGAGNTCDVAEQKITIRQIH